VLKSKQSGEIMREIKFRGRKLDEEDWLIGNLSIDGKKCFIYNNFGSVGYAVDPKTIGQFTGLVDMDGNEIYEGDILYNRIDGSIKEVMFEYGLYNGESYAIGYNEPISSNNVRVVGNIYDAAKVPKNFKEFKKLRKLYKKLSKSPEIIEQTFRVNDTIEEAKQVLTGFGLTSTCTLCAVVYEASGVKCENCVWELLEKHTPGNDGSCTLGYAKKSYIAIEDASTPEKLAKAYKDRAKLMKKVIKWIDNGMTKPFKE